MKALVLGPEESNVGDTEEDHGNPLKAQPESPTNLILYI